MRKAFIIAALVLLGSPALASTTHPTTFDEVVDLATMAAWADLQCNTKIGETLGDEIRALMPANYPECCERQVDEQKSKWMMQWVASHDLFCAYARRVETERRSK